MKEFTVTEKNGEKMVEALLTTLSEFREIAEAQNLPYSNAILNSLSPIRYCKIEKYPGCLLGTMRVPPIEGRPAFAFGFYLQEHTCYLVSGNAAGVPGAADAADTTGTEVRVHIIGVPGAADAADTTGTERMAAVEDAGQPGSSGSEILEQMIAKVLQSGGDMRMPVQFLLLLFESMIREEVFQLEALEDGLGAIETQLLEEIPEAFDETIVSYQKKLTSLHTYYEQLMNVGDMMCSNLDNYLPESQRRYWEHFSARAERLHDHTETLRDYLMQIRSLYQAQIDAQQNRVITMLTIITTIFLPLSLIAGWYGMNFPQMPEFGWKYAYLGVVVISVLIVIGEILFFKKKKML